MPSFNESVEARFLLDIPVHIDGLGDLYSPSIVEIVDMTEDKYNSALNIFLLDGNKDEFKELGLTDLELITYFCMQDESILDLFFCALKIHFRNEEILYNDGWFYFNEFTDSARLTEEKFIFIKDIVRIANNLKIEKAEEYKAGDERARRLIELQKRSRQKVEEAKKQKINLRSLISAVGWKSKEFNFINSLNIYQLYDGYYRLQFIDNNNHVTSAIYAGTINAKDVKMSDINWANILK